MRATEPSFELRFIDTSAGVLPCVVRGPRAGPQILVLQPLFEEMNRTRRLLADVTRRLAAKGIGSWLIDLPGTGDSELRTGQASWAIWRNAVSASSQHIRASHGNHYIFSIRGGALLDDAAGPIPAYRLAPVASGSRLLRELMRTRAAAESERGTSYGIRDIEAELAAGVPVELGGYAVTPTLAQALASALLGDAWARNRTAVVGDGTADVRFEGPPVWRQAEPLPAHGLAAAVADDIAEWLR